MAQNVPAARTLLSGLRVLVVDDNQDMIDVLCALLGVFGARTVGVNSALEALDRLHEIRPDVVVSDLGMPEVDGLTFMALLRQRGESVPAVACTGYTQLHERALETGFDAVVTKPVDAHALAGLLAEIAGRTAAVASSQ
jgi:CheY-like chemotaxis protein